jgi:hypothetical protein
MGIDTRHCWSVYDALRKRGYSEIESEDLMLAVCLEAIREQPKEFALTRVGHFILCWIKPPNGEWFRYDQPMVEGTTIVAGRYDGQKTWYCPSLADLHNTLMRHLWKPRRRVYLLGAMAVLGSWLAMLLNPRLRTMGVAFGLVMGYLSAVLTVFGQPEYRYRIVLEPVMIVVFVAGAGSVIEMVRARRDRAILKSPEVK